MELFIVSVKFVQDRERSDEFKQGYRLVKATSELHAMDKVVDYMYNVEDVYYVNALEASKVID